MDPYQITLNDTLLERIFQNDGLKPLLEELLNQVLIAQVTEQIGAEPYERSPLRQNSRNGYRERPITTRIGTLTLQVPRLRHGKTCMSVTSVVNWLCYALWSRWLYRMYPPEKSPLWWKKCVALKYPSPPSQHSAKSWTLW